MDDNAWATILQYGMGGLCLVAMVGAGIGFRWLASSARAEREEMAARHERERADLAKTLDAGRQEARTLAAANMAVIAGNTAALEGMRGAMGDLKSWCQSRKARD